MTEFREYHDFLNTLESARPADNSVPYMASVYAADLNLATELADLPDGSTVVDIGCGAGVGTAALKKDPKFCQLNIVGVTPNPIVRSGNRDITIHKGTIEGLTATLRNPVDTLLARNVMHEILLGERTCGASGLTWKALTECYDSLINGGKLLIYDQYGKGERGVPFYDAYRQLGTEIGFRGAEELVCPPRKVASDKRICPTYVRLTK